MQQLRIKKHSPSPPFKRRSVKTRQTCPGLILFALCALLAILVQSDGQVPKTFDYNIDESDANESNAFDSMIRSHEYEHWYKNETQSGKDLKEDGRQLQQVTTFSNCFFCCKADICGTLSFKPVYHYSRGTGIKTIDARSWFSIEDPDCNIAYQFKESDRDALLSRIFSVDPANPGKFLVNSNNQLATDKVTWEFVAIGYNPCDERRYYLQYFAVSFSGPDCTSPKLFPPVWQSTALSQSLYTAAQFLFKPATVSPSECGVFTYCVVWGNPEKCFYEDFYDIVKITNLQGWTQSFQGLLKTKLPFVSESPYSIKIKAIFDKIGTTTVDGATYSEVATLTIKDPCFNTTINSQSFQNMTYKLNDATAVQEFEFFTDTVSKLYSGQFGNSSNWDICAPQTYSVVDAATLAPVSYAFARSTANGGQIVVQTQKFNDTGSRSLSLCVNLSGYAIRRCFPFRVTIEACTVTGINLTVPPDLRIFYSIGAPANQVPLPSVFLTPSNCGQFPVYKLVNQLTGKSEPWATIDVSAGKISIFSTNTTIAGTYYLVLTVNTNGDSTANPVEVVYQVTIDACGAAVVVANGNINSFKDFTYSTSTGLLSMPLPYDSSIANCQLDYFITTQEITRGAAYDKSIFALTTTSFTIKTNDISYVGLKFKVQILGRITQSGNSKFVEFVVTIANGCFSAFTVIPPSPISSPPFTFSLWTQNSFRFNQAAFVPTGVNLQSWWNCGVLAYKLVDAETQLPIDTTAFQLTTTTSELRLAGLPPSRVPWLANSPFKYKIQITLGVYLTQYSDPFDVIVTDPCISTQLQSVSIATFFAQVNGSLINATIPQIKDSVSQQFGGTFGNGSGFDLCGPRVYQLFEDVAKVPTFAKFATNQPSLIIEAKNVNEIGKRSMVLEVRLVQYSSPFLKINFFIQISGCQINSLAIGPASPSSYTYEIQSPSIQLQIPIPAITVSPNNCQGGGQQGLNFVITQTPQNPVVSRFGNQLLIQTDDPKNAGNLTVTLKIEPASPSPAPAVSVTYIVLLRRCQVDQVRTTTLITDFNYTIGQGNFSIGPNIQNLFSECPLVFQLTQAGQQPGVFTSGALSFNTQTGILLLNDKGLPGLTGVLFRLELKGTSSGSGQQVVQNFAVTFISACSSVVLTPPQFQDQPPVNAFLWKQTDVFFNLPTAQPSSCASFTYKVYESITGQEISPQLFVIRTNVAIPFLRFTLPSRVPYLTQSPFQLTVEAIYGTFGITRSSKIDINVFDTCFTTKITPQNIVQMTTFVNAPTPSTRLFNIFTDAVSESYSTQYGNGSGYDLCGPQSYKIREIVKSQQVTSSLVSIDSVNRVLTLKTTSILDQGLHDMLLCVTIDNYAIEYCQPFAALVSNCTVTQLLLSYKTPPGSAITYQIQKNAPSVIVPLPNAVYTPSVCVYDLLYTAVLFNNAGPLPSFLTLGKTGITILTGDPNNFGTYQVQLAVKVNGPNTVGEIVMFYNITLTRCLLDQVSQPLAIPDISYNIGRGPLTVPTNIKNLFAECPITLTLLQNGAAFDRSTFTLDTIKREIVILTSQSNMKGQSFDFVLTAIDAAANQIQDTFKISLKDACESATFTAPQLIASDTQNLFVEKVYFFSLATISEQCGAFTYSLLDFNTGLPLNPPIFQIDTVTGPQPFIRGTIPSRVPYLANSPLKLQIKTTLQFSSQIKLSNPLSITVFDPCFSTKLQLISLNDMVTSVNAVSPVIQNFPAFFDSVSQGYSTDFGNGSGKDLCGIQSYSLFQKRSDRLLYPVPNWVTFDSQNRNISAKPDQFTQVGSYELILRVSLQTYGLSLEQSFQVFVDDCKIVKLTLVAPSTLVFTYDILPQASTMIIPSPQVIVQPSQCSFHGVLYTWTFIGLDSTLPSFATQISNGLAISTTQASFAGSYKIQLDVNANGPNTVGTLVAATYSLTITACRVNRVIVTDPQPDFTYYISSGSLTIPNGFTSEQAKCAITYTFVEEGTGTFNPAIYSFNTTTGVVVVSTANVLLHQKQTTLILKAVSALSGFTSSQIFKITFMDPCKDVILKQPRFLDSSVEVSVYKSAKFFFEKAELDPILTTCGSITYSLINEFDNQPLVAPVFTITAGSNSFVQILANSSAFAQNSPYNLVLVAKLGTYAQKKSDPLFLQITDPCTTTVLVPQQIPQLVTAVNSPLVTYQVPFFKDSVSILYSSAFGNGSGSDICGSQTYTLFEQINNSLQSVSFASLTTQANQQIVINIQTADPRDSGTHTMILEVLLTKYTKVLQQQFQIKIGAGTCTITSLSVASGQNLSLKYDIKNPQQPQIFPFPLLNVVPSTCTQSYTYQIINTSTSVQPQFASITGDGIQVLTGDKNLIQTYNLALRITPNGPNTVGTLSVPYTLKITGCIFDEVSVSKTIGEVVYQVNNGVVTVTGDFKNLYSTDCPFSNQFSLQQVGYGGPGAFDSAIFTFSTNSAAIKISSNNLALVGQTISLKLTATASQTSGSSATDNFVVQFTSGCSGAVLTPANLNLSLTVLNLYQAKTIFFSPAASSLLSCGSITYQVINVATNSPLVIQQKTFDIPAAKLTLLTVDKECTKGPTRIVIRATQTNVVSADSPVFEYTCLDPCLQTLVDPINVPQLNTSVKKTTPVTFTFSFATDSVSRQFTNTFGDGSGQDICGPRAYKVFEVIGGTKTLVPFAQIQPDGQDQKISVKTLDQNDEGLHSMVLEITLTDYGIIRNQSFSVKIDACQLVSITNQTANILDQVYLIGDPALSITLPPYVQTPACNLVLSITFTVSPSTIPANVITLSSNQLEVSTTNLAAQGSYIITITAKSGQISSSLITFKLLIQTNIPGCIDESVAITDAPSVSLYYISAPRQTIQISTTQSTNLGCPLACTLTQDNANVGVFDQALIAVNCSTKQISVFTTDPNYDLKVISLTFNITSVLSQSPQKTALTTFTVSVKNRCRDVSLTPPAWKATEVEFDFRNTQNLLSFDKATFTADSSCDSSGFTYSLNDLNNDPVAAAMYSVFITNPPNVRIMAPQGTYFFKLVASSPYGASVSQPIKVFITDLCLETAYSITKTLIELQLTVLGPRVTQSFDKPKAAFESTINIPGICGQVTYQLILKSGPIGSNFSPTIDTGVPSVSGVSTNQAQVGSYKYTLRSQTVSSQYPQLFIDRDLFVTIDECIVTFFTFGQALPDIEYTVNSSRIERQIDPFIIQPLCSYQIGYNVNLVNNANQLAPLPRGFEFIEDSKGKLSLSLGTADESQVGQYLIQVTGSIESGPSRGTSSNFRFFVRIRPDDGIVQENTAPIFLTDLPPEIRATAGEDNFTFDLQIPEWFDPEGDNVKITFDFSIWQGWLVYDARLRNVTPNRSGGNNFDLVPTGSELISISLTDDNPAGPKSTFYSIAIIVAVKPIPPIVDPCLGINPPPSCFKPPIPVTPFTVRDGLISDQTNTGDVVLNIPNDFDMVALVSFYQNPKRRRQLADELPHMNLAQTGNMRLLQALDIAVETNELIRLELIPSPQSNPIDLGFSWQLVAAQDGEVKLHLDFDNPEKVSAQIDNDQIKITVFDPLTITDPKSKDIKPPTVTIQDIVRQIDGGSDMISKLINVTFIIEVVWVVVGILSFTYFLILTSGREDPFLWSFLETMQLLTHIQLVNVKIPGNAALFLNQNNSLFRYNFFPNEWVTKLFKLDLVPSPNLVFIQIRYLQVHMLQHTIFIFGCLCLVLILMASVPLIRRCSPKTAEALHLRLFWGVPTRMIFEFYFILALTAWNNMLNPNTDASVVIAYVVLVVLFIYTAYIYYTLCVALRVQGDSQTLKNQKVKKVLKFIQRPLRLARNKPHKFIYPVYYLTRRMLLAITFVYLQDTYASQWLIWTMLSLGMLFIVAKIRPFGDTAMNVVQFINELFIFAGSILMMPLCNNLNNLDQRNNVGWCLYAVVMACIIFNILILLLRSISIFCEYISARSKLVLYLGTVILDKDVDDEVSAGPFEQQSEKLPREKYIVRPLARDFATFGMGQNVKNSIESMHIYTNENWVHSGQQSQEVEKQTKIKDPEVKGGFKLPPLVPDKYEEPVKKQAPVVMQKAAPPELPNLQDQNSILAIFLDKDRHNDKFETEPISDKLIQVPAVPEDPIEEPDAKEPNKTSKNDEPQANVNQELNHQIDQWKEQYSPENGWEMYPEPTDGRINLPQEPTPTDEQNKRNADQIEESEPARLQKNANKILIIVVNTKETKVIHTQGNTGNIEPKAPPHKHEENDDCPVCNASKSKKPTVGQIWEQAVAESVNMAMSSESGVAVYNDNPHRSVFDRNDPLYINQAKTGVFTQGNQSHIESEYEDDNSVPQISDYRMTEARDKKSNFTGQNNMHGIRRTEAKVTAQVLESGYDEDKTSYGGLSIGRTVINNTLTGYNGKMAVNPATGVVYRQQEENKVARITTQNQNLNDSMRSSNNIFELREDRLDDDAIFDGIGDTSGNAWQRAAQLKNNIMEPLEEVDSENQFGRSSQQSAQGVDFDAYLNKKQLNGSSESVINQDLLYSIESGQNFQIQQRQNQNNAMMRDSDSDILIEQSLEQLGPRTNYGANSERLRNLQRTVNTGAEQLEYELNPRESEAALNLPPNVKESLFGNGNFAKK